MLLKLIKLMSRDKHSFDLNLTRTFVTFCGTGSSTVATECQFFFKFLPTTYQIDLRTAKFLQQFAASESCICQCFSSSALNRVNSIYLKCGNSVLSICLYIV
jgi:hypothetical protein